MFKKLALGVATASVLASTAIAGSYTDYGKVTDVVPIYETQTVRTPHEVCRDVEVTERSGGNAGDALAGAVIGGVIGKGATGNDKGAAVGAIIGAIIAGENSKKDSTSTTRIERQCETQYETRNDYVLKHYKVQYRWNGKRGVVYTYNEYEVGDRIELIITHTPK